VAITAASALTVNQGSLITASGNVSVQATTGNVNVGEINSSAGVVTIQAGGSVVDGDSAIDVTALGLVVSTGSTGGVGSSTDALETAVGSLTLSVGSGGATISESNGLETTGLQSAGALVVNVLAGDLNVKDGSTAVGIQASGNLRLSAAGAVSIQTSVMSVGNVSVQATTGNVNVGEINSSAGVVTIQAGASVVDGDSAIDVTALSLVVSTGSAGGVGSSTDALETAVNTLTLSVGSGGAYISESNGLDTTGVQSTGALVVNVLAGDLNVKDGSTATGIQASGNLRLSAAGAVSIQSTVTSAGNLSVVSTTGDVTFASTGDITVTGSGTVDVQAAQAVNQGNVITAGGNVSVQASAGNVTLGQIDSSAGNVAIQAGASVIDGDSAIDVSTVGLYVSALKVGSGSDAIDTSVATLSVSVGSGGAFISESNGLSTGTVSVVVNRVNLSGVAETQVAVGTQGAGLQSTEAGALVLQVQSGDLAVNAGTTATGVQANGHVLLSATGVVAIDADITSAGSVSVISTASNVNLAATGALTLTGSGSLEVQAEQSLVMANVVNTVGNVSLKASIGDITLSQVTSSAGSVALQAGGSVIDGDTAVDITAQGLFVKTGSQGGLGNLADPLETSINALSATVGRGGAYVLEISGLQVDAVSVAVNRISTDGAAQAQAVIGNTFGQLMASGGGALSVNVSAGDLQFKTGSQVQTTGTGTINLKSSDGSVVQEQGSQVSSDAGAVQVDAKDKAQMTKVNTVSGDVAVSSTQGSFELPAVAPGEVVDYGGKPVRIKSVDVQINAPVVSAGSSFELTTPGQTVNLSTLNSTNAVTVTSIPVGQALPVTLPFVLGDAMGATNSGVSVDRTEVGFIGSTDPAQQLKEIVVGSQAPGQLILLQSDTQHNGSLVFNAPLVLIASGLLEQGGVITGSAVKITGDIQGRGLTVYGSGSTVTYEGANLTETGDIVIYDSVIVNQDTTLTATGDIKIQGKITVKPGVTLTLVADHVTLSSGVFNGVTRGGVFLLDDASSSTDMATLKITANDLTVDVAIDGGDVGKLVLQGGVLGNGKEAELASLATAMVDGSFASLSLGDVNHALSLGNGSLLAENADAVTLIGSQVHLADSAGGTATWALNTKSLTVQAGGGDVSLDVNLISTSATDVSFKAASGNFIMTANAKVRTEGGSLTVQAGGDVVIGELNASAAVTATVGGVALDSAQGVIRAASTSSGLVSAYTVSMYGYGPTVIPPSGQSAIQVQAQQLQVSAPKGQVVRDSGSNGETYYTLINRNTYYRQAIVLGTAPTNVVVDKSQVAGNAQGALTQVKQTAQMAMAYLGQGMSYGLTNMRTSPTAAALPAAGVRSYLAGVMQASQPVSAAMSIASGISVSAPTTSSSTAVDLLSDLSYGMSADTTAAFVLGSPGVQTTSSGVKATSVLSFDYEA